MITEKGQFRWMIYSMLIQVLIELSVLWLLFGFFHGERNIWTELWPIQVDRRFRSIPCLIQALAPAWRRA